LLVSVVQPLSGAQKFTNYFVIVVCGVNVQTGSIGSFTVVTESMSLDVGSIGANNLPVDPEL
jgi:hypothetical protein